MAIDHRSEPWRETAAVSSCLTPGRRRVKSPGSVRTCLALGVPAAGALLPAPCPGAAQTRSQSAVYAGVGAPGVPCLHVSSSRSLPPGELTAVSLCGAMVPVRAPLVGVAVAAGGQLVMKSWRRGRGPRPSSRTRRHRAGSPAPGCRQADSGPVSWVTDSRLATGDAGHRRTGRTRTGRDGHDGHHQFQAGLDLALTLDAVVPFSARTRNYPGVQSS